MQPINQESLVHGQEYLIEYYGPEGLLSKMRGTMNDDGSFYTSNATTAFLQAFVPYELINHISYKQMKHALYNLCFAKYTLKGFSAVESNKTKLDERKALIDSTVTKSLCNDVIVATPTVPTTPTPTPTSTTVIA